MSEAKTNVKTMKSADWNQIEQDVVSRIRAMKATVEHMEENAVNDQICQDVILPLIEMLTEFCAHIEAGDEE